MDTRTTEIADNIFQISTLVPDIGPSGFRFNQYLIVDEEPLVFHTGPRAMFPLVREAISSLTPLESLRWIAFGHVEADECGSMNEFLAAAPRAEVAHGALGCMVSLNDLADRPPVSLDNGQVIDLGHHRVRHIDTPHVPHGWEARVLFEEVTGTLLCGDLFTQLGDTEPVTTDDIVAASGFAEDIFGATCLTPTTGSTIRSLAELEPSTLAVMHGACFSGDVTSALASLADDYESRLLALSA